MKTGLSLLALCGAAAAAKNASYPTTFVSGVEVIDTQLIRDVRATLEVFNELQPYLYKHLHRTWLFGVAAINANETLKSTLDLELHAIGTLFHDLGWDMREGSPWVSQEQRFEVDSGKGAVDFIKSKKCTYKGWDAVRLEKLYDGIALQTEASIISQKNIDSYWIFQSVYFEFPGPRNPLIPEKDYNQILADYPNSYLYRGSNETFTWMASHKPDGSYNTFIQDFGTAYVPGYNATGHRLFDMIGEAVASEIELHPNATKYD
ncbi:hypothetical protein GGR57DRAFT_470285 [Xylariaceae sp. FL1272]|nr:hypothetical protein GGR57DRAFT_470285 [Xylariaceae sp. FL1272]